MRGYTCSWSVISRRLKKQPVSPARASAPRRTFHQASFPASAEAASRRQVASLRGSTYRTEYASPPRSLRPRLGKGMSRVIECRALGGWAGENSRRGWAGEIAGFLNILMLNLEKLLCDGVRVLPSLRREFAARTFLFNQLLCPKTYQRFTMAVAQGVCF